MIENSAQLKLRHQIENLEAFCDLIEDERDFAAQIGIAAKMFKLCDEIAGQVREIVIL